MKLIPEHRKNITKNITHQESDDNQTNRAGKVKRHHRKRIIERV